MRPNRLISGVKTVRRSEMIILHDFDKVTDFHLQILSRGRTVSVVQRVDSQTSHDCSSRI